MMKSVILIFLTICLFQQTLSWHTIFTRDWPDEYLGCFNEEPANRVFTVAPGDYKVNDLSPIQCMVVCGQAFKYASIQNGIHCMCSDNLPTNKTDDKNCPAICQGTLAWPVEELRPKCGGINTISVYTVENRILGLAIRDPGIIMPRKREYIQASIKNGKEIEFFFQLGDGDATKPAISIHPNISHIYDRPGAYKIKVTAKNNVSGSETAERWIEVKDEPSNVTIDCPYATVVGAPIICNGIMGRGSDVFTVMDFGDNTQETLFISAYYGNVGPRIPTFKTLEETATQSPFTIVSPQAEFDQERTISSVEIEAMSSGNLNVLIMRPQCNSAETYCHKKHSCIVQGTECIQYNQEKCAASEVFCLYSGKCVPNKDDSLKTCAVDQSFNFPDPPADYKVVHMVTLAVPSKGHHFLHLLKKDKFVAKPGDILGWTRSKETDATLAYAKIYEGGDVAPEFQYSETAKIGDVLMRSKGVRRLSHHIVSAHYVEPSKFSLYHTYTSPGAYRLTSNISMTQLIYADLPISGVKFTCPKIVTTNTSVPIDIAKHAGTNTTYWWDLGNGDIFSTQQQSVTLVYPFPGVFKMTMNAMNSLSNIKFTCWVQAYDSIRNLTFFEPIMPQKLGAMTKFHWKIATGTNVTFRLILGNGESNKVFTPLERNNSLSVIYEFTYNRTGHYNITIIAENAVGPRSTISATSIIEVPLQNISFTTSLPHVTNTIFIAEYDNVSLLVSFKAGTDPYCQFSFGDNATIGYSTRLHVQHIYSHIGIYQANVECKNYVSYTRSPLNATFVVQKLEPISNMSLYSHPTAWKNASIIYMNMTTGTTFFCSWSLGDGTKFQTDYSSFGIPIKHIYKMVGDYYTNVSCWNRLGLQKLSVKIPVDIPITLFNITCPAKYLKVNQLFSVQVRVNSGSRVRYIYNLGDNTEKVYINKSGNETIMIGHKYQTPGQYRLAATAENQFNKMEANCSQQVKVEYPVEKVTMYSNSPIAFDNGIVNFYCFKSPGFIHPTDALIEWNFGDGNRTGKLPANLDKSKLVLRLYKYQKPGVYKANVKIYNNVSILSFNLTIDVQKLVPAILTVRYPDPVTFQMVPGKGPKQDHFPLESSINFAVTSQPKDLYYLFDFKEGNKVLNSSTSILMHKFLLPGTYNVSCQVENILRTSIKYAGLTIVETIKKIKLSGPEASPLGENVTFTVSAEKYGSHVCYVIDFGDFTKAVFNSTSCGELTSDKKYNYTYYSFSYPSKPLEVKHVFWEKGFYTVQLHSRNPMGEEKASLTIEITYKPCGNPTALIGNGGPADAPVPTKKSVMQVFEANFTADCGSAEKLIFNWRAFTVSTNNMNDESKVINLAPLPLDFEVPMPYKENKEAQLQPNLLRLPERILPFGLVMIKLTLSYKSTVDDLEDVIGGGKVWIKVEPTPLETQILGGKSKSVGFELDHPLDGMASDPDEHSAVGTKGMTFEWYCKEEREVFTPGYTTTDTKAGCFKEGSYRLQEKEGRFKYLSLNKLRAQVYTGDLVQFKTYTFRIVVKKGDKVSHYDQKIKVLPGRPPTMSIVCKMNCKKKVSSIEDLKIESVCTDCKANTKLFFLWRIAVVHKSPIDKEKVLSTDPIDNFEQYTTTGVNRANLAVKQNVFVPGKFYSLKVAAWKAGGNASTGGFSETEVEINIPPAKGHCTIMPKKGYAIATNFTVFCDKWEDEDKPLTYQVDIRKNYVLGNTVENLQNMYSGIKKDNIFLILPMGEKLHDFKVGIFFKIIDRLGGITTLEDTVEVKEPVQVDMTAFTNSLSALADGDNVQAVAQRAVAAGSVINKDNKDTKQDNATSSTSGTNSARNGILKSVSKVKACSVDQIKQMGGVFSEMTSKPDEVDKDSADSSSSALGDMSKCMLQADAQNTGLKSASLSLLQGSSNVMQSFQKSGEGNLSANGTANVTADPAAVNASSKVFDTMDSVGGSYMRQMVAGDKPAVVKTGGMDIQMAQVSDDADDDELGFKLPSSEALKNSSSSSSTGSGSTGSGSTGSGSTGGGSSGGGSTGGSSVGAMMTSSSKNPFGSGGGSDDIKSDVMGLTLTDAQGNPIDMAGQEIQMFVKRDLSDYVPPDMHTFTDKIMNVHKFNYSSLDSGMGIEIRPVDPKTIFVVWISYGQRPTSSRKLANFTLPTLEQAAKMKKLPDPFTYIMTNGGLNGTGEYYLGIKIRNRDSIYSDFGYVPLLNYTLRIYESKCKMWDANKMKWSTEGCKIGPKTTFNKTHCQCTIPTETEEVLPATAALTSKLFTTAAPTTPVVIRKLKKVAKRVSFAGGFFVAPNPIDFSKAFAGFANLAENPVAFATVLSIFGVYLILLFWARREDRKDIQRAGVTPLEENDVTDKQFYEIAVFTGFNASATTTSKVFIQLSGDEGETDARELKDPNRSLFQARGQDMFLASYPDLIGDINFLRIWHDNSGKKPAWYLSRVQITDLNTNRKYLFINENRLAVEEGDGTVERSIPIAGPEEIAGFNHLFYSTTQKNLTDGHLWFSIFIRPAKSRFTRVQRLSCCLTLLYCTMVANAMFYEVGGQTDPSTTIHVGPFAFSPSQIGIGVMSSLVIFPANLILVGIFRNAGPKPSPEEMKKKKSKRCWCLRDLFFCFEKETKKSEFMDIIHTVGDSEDKRKRNVRNKYDVMEEVELEDENFGLESGEIGFKFEKEDPLEKEKAKKKKKPKKKQFPYWFKYIAWVLLVLTSFTSAFFVVLYGFQFGKEKSAQWISSLMISFVQDVCVSQPIKILLLGLFIALVVKKPAEDEEEEDENKKKHDEEYLFNNNDDNPRESKRPANIIRFQPPSKEKIKAARDFRLKELKMYNIVRDIIVYFLFVISLCTVSYTHLDPQSFNYRKSLEDTFVNGVYGGKTSFSAIQSREDYWSWMNTTVVNGLFASHWYNGEPNIPGFTQDLYSNLFGGARIRQLRVKRHTCQIPKEARSVIKECNGWYSWSNEDTAQYDIKWKKIKNESLYNPPPTFKSWEYLSSDELDTYPFVGYMSAYGGGGYTGDLGKYPLKSYKLINSLHSKEWVNQQTRAVFLEICVYNAQVNLFAIMNFIVEFLPTNGIVHFYNIKIARLYTFGGGTQSFNLACQFFVLLFLLIFIYKEAKRLYKQRKAYFNGFWNAVEFIMIVLILGTISVFFSRLLLVNAAVARIQENSSGGFVSFNKVATWDDLFTYMMSTLVLVSCIKSIRLLQFNKTISILASTLKGSAKPLSAFSIVFTVFFLAYAILGFIIFVQKLDDYKSFVTAMESLMGLLLGSFDFHAMWSAQRIIAPIYFFSVVLFGVFYVLNVFLTIIMDTYAEVKEDVSKQDNEYEIVDFMVRRFKRWVGIKSAKNEELNELIPESPKLKATKTVRRHRRTMAAKIKQQCPPKNKTHASQQREALMKKFKELDSSLNGLCVEDYAEDKFMDELLITGYKGENPFDGQSHLRDLDSLREEAYYQQDLYEELNKWS